jgi:hypothetical protein
MRKLRHLAAAVAAALVLACAPWTRAAELPAVFDQAPNDAAVIVAVPNMAQLSEQISALNDVLGLGPGTIPDMLGEFKREMGATKGLKDDGAAMIVITDAKAFVDSIDGPGDDPPLVVLLPVSDYQAFTANYQGAAEGDLMKLTMPNSPEPGWSKKLGDWAVMGPSKQRVANYQPGNNRAGIASMAGPLGSRYLATSHASVFLNMEVLKPHLMPVLAEARQEMEQQFANLPDAGPEAEAAKFAMSMARLMLDTVDAALRDGHGVVLGVDLTDQGAGMTFAAQFKPGSETAMTIGRGGNAARAMASLPNQPYLFATAVDVEGMGLGTLLEKLDRAMPQDGGWLASIMRQSLPLLKGVKSMASLTTVPQQPIGIGGSLFSGVSIATVDDANSYKASYQTYLEEMGKIKVDIPAQPGAAGGPGQLTMTTKYSGNVLQIEGVQIDQYQMKVNFPPQLMQQMGPAAPLMMMTGAQGSSGYIASVDNKVIMTTTPDPAVMKAGIVAARQGDGLGTGGVLKQVREAGLPPNPMAEFYVGVGGLVQMGTGLAAMFGQPIRIDVPQDLPPIAMGASVEEGGIASRLFVPRQTMVFIKDAAAQVQKQMQGGGAQPGQPRPF